MAQPAPSRGWQFMDLEAVKGGREDAEARSQSNRPAPDGPVRARLAVRRERNPMFTVRRDEDRHHLRRRRQESWRTFFGQSRLNARADGFGALTSLDESRFAPGAGTTRHVHREVEIVTYVREGALAHEDSLGRSGVIHAGEFQRMTAGSGLRHGETNASGSGWAHIFQVGVRPSERGLEPSHEQQRFPAAERRGLLRVVASPDGRGRSLRLHLDALLYSAILDPGQHLIHELSVGRAAWLHLVEGSVSLGDVLLLRGDGAAITAERAVSLTAQDASEILLLDLLPGWAW